MYLCVQWKSTDFVLQRTYNPTPHRVIGIRSKLVPTLTQVGFYNGVFDLQRKELRQGRPEDMVSFRCPYDLPWDTTSEDDLQPVIQFMSQIFVDPELRAWF